MSYAAPVLPLVLFVVEHGERNGPWSELFTWCKISNEDTLFSVVKGIQMPRISSYRLKVNGLPDLTTCEFVSRSLGLSQNKVLSGLKHLGTHEYVGQHSWALWTGSRRKRGRW